MFTNANQSVKILTTKALGVQYGRTKQSHSRRTMFKQK